ncbi:MAG TPA: helix-turn-helix domain-containing protein [Gammaproteobacteria bacterium]|nr:helix-turn-helix domain-containing protein [Gammaproteobacteria bacterium]
MLIHSPKELALLVVNQRKKLKLSQAAVGKLVGLKQQTISEFEIRPESTQIDTLFRILSALGLDIQLTAKNEPAPKNKWKEEW